MSEPIDVPLKVLPAELQDSAALALQHFADAGGEPRDWSPRFRAQLIQLWGASPFAADICRRDPTMLERIRDGETIGYRRASDARTVEAGLQSRLAGVSDEGDFASRLRRFRHEEMVRILARDVIGNAELSETLFDLSELARVCLHEALAWLDAEQRSTWGSPRNADGEPQFLSVIGMGKLGGGELNFSSDVDLIFVYGEDGDVVGPRARSNAEYFTRLGQSLIRVIDQVTADGFVFRVDMRLRPNGESGPLVLPFDAFENYYAISGRDWERYAMIKARPVAGDPVLGERILAMLRPFVYRRYLDFNAIDSLREMKRMIAHQVARKGHDGDIKLGSGGIRDVEFIAQSFQLVWGGRYPNLRTRSVQTAIRELAELGLIEEQDSAALLQAYAFLRRLENRLQAMSDHQTQQLPEDATEQSRIAYAMGFDGYPRLLEHLDRERAAVRVAFDTLVAADLDDTQADESSERHAALSLIWAGATDAVTAATSLNEVGFEAGEEANRRLRQFQKSAVVRSLSEAARQRLDRLLPALMIDCTETDDPNRTLYRVLDLLEAIARRTSYIALLVEKPVARQELVRLIGASPWIAEQLARQPILIDELLDPAALRREVTADELLHDLERRMGAVAAGDVEQEMEALRAFKGAQVLHVAAAEVAGYKRLMKVSDALSDIAGVALERTVRLAWRDMAEKWGTPQCGSPGARRTPGFGVVGYGKLGGLEMGYGSDLDLVFLHDSEGEDQVTDGERAVENSVFFARLGQRITHYLATQTPGGRVYEVDMRLRPSGNSGMLVGSTASFARYQAQDAWTWEHQALVRGRFIAGDAAIETAFRDIRHEVLSRPRDVTALSSEVAQMRSRMVDAHDDAELFDVKHSPGGMVDIEFIAQFGVLAWSQHHAHLTQWSDNVRIFELFAQTGLMRDDEAKDLIDGYLALRAENHRLALLDEPARLPQDAFRDVRARVRDIWKRYVLQTD
ncbi:MAG: bifunctional [glutamate--ammonia ligase]-adenylyl-L-tyrosine phosphorylase/[glutamate--ammonia-ligase] adenylyltransferase [Pseudomonadota bacterium]